MSRTLLNFTPQERRRLRHQLRSTHEVGLYRRTLALLAVEQGLPIGQLADVFQMNRRSLQRWIERYRQAHRPEVLADHRGMRRSSILGEDEQAVLRTALQEAPQVYGYPNTAWTISLLLSHLARWSDRTISEDTLRRQLHQWGYVWKRFRYLLAEDPELEKKTQNSAPNQEIAATPCGIGGRRN